jgi:hypothetical protein
VLVLVLVLVLALALVMELAASRAAGRAGRLRLCYVIARGGHSRPCFLLLAPTKLTPTQPHTAAHRRTQAPTQTLPHTQEQTPPHTLTQTPPSAMCTVARTPASQYSVGR